MEKVCLLLSTYNGGKYLQEQLDSIFSQQDVEVLLVVRDDGSSDNTLDILKFNIENGQNILMPSELNGYHCKNGIGSSYMQLLRYALNNYESYNYFGFADQDDVWLSQKVIKAISMLDEKNNPSKLYFSKKIIVDENLQVCGEDVVRFQNNLCDYLSTNDASGCTMVFSKRLAEIILSNQNILQMPFYHDVDVFNIATVSDTDIVLDNNSYILYRQHGSNDVGVNSKALISRKNIKKIFKPHKHYTKKFTKMLLDHYTQYLREDAKTLLDVVDNHYSVKNSIFLLKYYYKYSERSIKDKVKFTAEVFLNGI